MAKIVLARAILTVDDIEALKQKTGENTAKEALSKAVMHYLECEFIQEGDILPIKTNTVYIYDKK
jgi:hypothetical protein